MRVSNGSSTVEVRSFSEKTDLLRHLQGKGTFTLLDSPEEEREFYSIVIQPSFASTRAGESTFGVCSDGQGLSPELLLMPEKSLLFVGFNWNVVVINSESGQVVFKHQLGSLFWSFVQPPSSERILVFYEIGVKALDSNGRELWDYSRDLLKSATLQDDVLSVSFSDSPPVSIELSTGRTRVVEAALSSE